MLGVWQWDRWNEACFRANAEGGWDFFPCLEARLGYRIDNATKLKLDQIAAKELRFLGVFFAMPFLALFFVSDPGARLLAEIGLGLSPATAITICLCSMYALSSYWMNAIRRKQLKALADLAPMTVTLSPEESQRLIARQMFYGHPKAYVVGGTLLVAGYFGLIYSGDPSPYRFPALLIPLPFAWLVLRAWRLTFSAAKI